VLAVWAAGLLAACSPKPAAQVAPPEVSPEQRFAALERRYVIFMLERFPVVSTYWAAPSSIRCSPKTMANCGTTRRKA